LSSDNRSIRCVDVNATTSRNDTPHGIDYLCTPLTFIPNGRFLLFVCPLLSERIGHPERMIPDLCVVALDSAFTSLPPSMWLSPVPSS